MNEIFPETDYTKLQYDEEGLYSITCFKEADIISNLLLNNYINMFNITPTNILDACSGVGGNTYSFCKHFRSITSIELNENRFKMLVNNVELYELKNVKMINCNSLDYFYNNFCRYDIYFFDPPWGGKNYKQNSKLKLKFADVELVNLVKFLKNKAHKKFLVFKLPLNYDISEFSEHNYKLYKLKKFFLFIFYIK
jgi:16S rRNA G966 N2-methylase RsmD